MYAIDIFKYPFKNIWRQTARIATAPTSPSPPYSYNLSAVDVQSRRDIQGRGKKMNTIYWNKTLANHTDYFINSFAAHKRWWEKESRACTTNEQNKTAKERALESFCATK